MAASESMSPAREALAVAALAAVAVVFWWQVISLPLAREDEKVYLEAAAMVNRGLSPFEAERYFYPPAFAELGAWAVRTFGELGYLYLLRGLTVLGAAATVWFASAGTGWSPWVRGLAGGLVLAFADAVRVGLTAGNVSAAVIGGVVFALAAWPRWPALAGVALGAGIAFKPIAVLVPPLFLVFGLRHRSPAARKMAIWSGVAAAVTLLPGVSHLLELPSAVSGGAAFHPRNLSLSRVLYCFGLEVPSILLVAAVLVASACGLLVMRPSPRALGDLGIVATLLALPIVWIYTLLLALPLQWLALARVASRRRSGRPLREPPNLLALLAVLSLFLSHAAGGVETWPLWLQGLVMAVPAFSPAYLWVFCHGADLSEPRTTTA